MPTTSLSKDGRLYVAKQTAYATIRHTDGTASLAATDACKHKTFTVTVAPGRVGSTDKEDNNDPGFVDRTIDGGHKVASFSCSHELRGSAAAGTEPDYGPLLECAFGKKTVGAGSVLYEFDPTAVGQACELWGFDLPANVTQWCAFGCIPNRITFGGGEENSTVAFEGPAFWGLSNDQFDTATTAEKGGLIAFPAEPATQTYTGTRISGVTGSITVDGITYGTIRRWGITLDMARAYDMEVFGQVHGTDPFEYVPSVTLDFTVLNNDLAGLIALKKKALARTAVDATVVIGSAAGAIYTFALKRLILPYTPALEEGGRKKTLTFSGCRAQMNAATGARDEATLTLT